MKRKLEGRAIKEAPTVSVAEQKQQQLHFTKRQLRSRIPRRRRLHISPVIISSVAAVSHFTAVSEVSCDSSIASVGNLKPLQELPGRVVTRAYYRKRFRNEIKKGSEPLELSENSCVESCSGANRESALDISVVKDQSELELSEVSESKVSACYHVDKLERDEKFGGGFAQHDQIYGGVTISKAEEISSLENDGVSVSSAVKAVKIGENREDYEELQMSKLTAFNFDLACSEQFSNVSVVDDCDEEEQSSSQPEIWQITSESEIECSEYTPSIWSYASGSQFSEKSNRSQGECPSLMFQLFCLFKQQFCRSSSASKFGGDEISSDFNFLGVDDEEIEESYKMLRERERRQVYLHDYAEEYCNNTNYGNLVIQQRLKMVHWIVDHATNEGLQHETMFLGVNLLDRFLSKGYFNNKMNIQIAGIACLTLATRIEENQIVNCIQRSSFFVGSTEYSRCEVVAMEWLVQEVLNFQCLLPTLHNFLWFYLKAARANEEVEKTSKYLAVLALMGHQQLCYWPSTVAAGLVVLASIAANQDESCNLVTAIHARQKDKDLPGCIESLQWLVKYL